MSDALREIVAALEEKGLDAHMSRAGAMLCLDSDEDGGQKYVLITASGGSPAFVVGYYHEKNPYGDDVEGEDCSVLPLAEAVALVEKIVKEGGRYG